MQSFLSLCAKHLANTYATKLSNTCIVLPTRRSGLVLKQLLKELKVKNFPEITHIEDFISKMANLQSPVQVMQLLELFEVFSEVDDNIKLEKFTSWGYILLKDFDLIDKNLVDANSLFDYLGDIKNLERWKLGEERITKKIDEYFKLWENLSYTYQHFRTRLLAQNQAYSGMMYRYVAENAQEILLKHPVYAYFTFIGFNALSKSEESIFKTLADADKAEIIWDADEYYMQDQTENKAGFFLKKYKKHWASTNWKFQSDYLEKSPKEITVIDVANASMQGKVANQILKNWQQTIVTQTAIVLADEHLLMPVLHSLDEQYAGLNITIGLSLKDSAIFNLVDTLFEQQQLVIRDKENDVIKFSHRTIIKLLNHPFIRQYERKNVVFVEESKLKTETSNEEVQNSLPDVLTDENIILENENAVAEKSEYRSFILLIMQHINRNNLIFLSQEELVNLTDNDLFRDKIEDETLLKYCQQASKVLNPLFEILFARWKNTFEILSKFSRLVELLNNQENYFESAYLREFDKILKQLTFFVEKNPKSIDMRTFKIFLYQAFREAKFDFENDKDAQLQLTGIVETRNLDFENLILLSVNETVLPRAKKINSFIPVDVCREFDLPTPNEQDAIISYHFYRLLQRTKQVALVYVAPSETYGAKEKSRFILQLENDLLHYNPLIQIKKLSAKFQSFEAREEKIIIIPKSKPFIDKMKENFTKGLSPTHINTFVNCSIKYYYAYIAEINTSSAVEETLGSDKIGTLVHEVLEEIYRELSQNNHKITDADLENVIPTIPQRVNNKFNLGKFANYQITGTNFINKNVTIQLLKSFLESQIKEIQNNQTPFEILSLENIEINAADERISPIIFASLNLQIADESIELTLKGITDRIDKVKAKVRIIDYKTAKVDKKDITLSKTDLDRLIDDNKVGYVRQLWLYKYIIAKRILESGEFQVGNYKIKEHEQISAGIYSLRNLDEGLLEIKTDDKTETSLFPETMREYVRISEEYLQKIIQNMLDTSKDFERTDDIKQCEYCNFKTLCNR